jgi:gamma-glutamylcyclotransferase
MVKPLRRPTSFLEWKMVQNASWYFAYGSNLNRTQFRSRAGQVLEEINGELKNYELVFNHKVRGGTASANIKQVPGKSIHGVLYRIPESAFRTLDRFEGVPMHYRRIEVRVTAADGREINTQVYIATKIEGGLRPSGHYLQSIVEGATQAGLPGEYIEQVRASANGR